jgi:hypothetical protein
LLLLLSMKILQLLAEQVLLLGSHGRIVLLL